MDVLAVGKGLPHVLIARNVGHDAQLDLAVIRVQQRAALTGSEIPAEPAAQFCAHGDVLQVRFVGRDAARAGFRLIEGGVNAPVRPDHLQKSFHIGGVQLLIGAVLQNVVDDRRIPAQTFQHIRAGGVSALGLFAGGQAQILKQRFAQLLGAVYVELVAHFLIDGGQFGGQRRLQFPAEGFNALFVHLNAGVLHLGQHFRKG